jgi:hypothetical protein
VTLHVLSSMLQPANFFRRQGQASSYTHHAAACLVILRGVCLQGAMPPGTNRLDVNAAAKASLQALATFEYLEPLLQVCESVIEVSLEQGSRHGRARMISRGSGVQLRPSSCKQPCSIPWGVLDPAFCRPQSEGLLEPLATIEMPLARVLAEVEAAGIAASPQRLAAQT